MIRVNFTKETRQALIDYYLTQGLVFIEEQRYVSGDFLIFDTQPKALSQEERLASLENRVKVLEGKIG